MQKNDFETSIVSPLFNLDEQGYYSCALGNTNARFVPFTDVAKHIYMQIFAVLDHFGVQYCVFAGTLVGYVRNQSMPAWMDDIDVMIFEKDIPLFEEVAAPYLLKCGFNCSIVGKNFAGGGYHILALQQGADRSLTVDYAEGIARRVPWAQFDVFFSNVDANNHIRNLKGWGLYHRKDVPIDWVFPLQTVEMNGMKFKTFANIEADVQKEYGNVRNELVVQTHGTVFLSAKHAPWHIVNAEFNRIFELTVKHLPPSVTQDLYDQYEPIKERVCTPSANASFDQIVHQIIAERAAKVRLIADDQIYWVMDLKRLLPDLHVSVSISSLISAKRAAHLNQFIDETSMTPGLAKTHAEMVTALTDVFGTTPFPSLPHQKVSL